MGFGICFNCFFFRIEQRYIVNCVAYVKSILTFIIEYFIGISGFCKVFIGKSIFYSV